MAIVVIKWQAPVWVAELLVCAAYLFILLSSGACWYNGYVLCPGIDNLAVLRKLSCSHDEGINLPLPTWNFCGWFY